MKKQTLLAMAVLASLASHSQEAETVLKSSTTTVAYASATAEGGLKVEHAWEGYRFVKRAGGNCFRIEHTNLRIETMGNAQRARFDETVTAVPCQ